MAGAFVQSANDVGGLDLPVYWNNDTTTGNTIIVAVESDQGAGDITGVTDDQSNTYVKDYEFTYSPSGAVSVNITIWRASKITGGFMPGIQITGTFSGNKRAVAREYSGLELTPFDRTTQASGSGTTPSSGSLSTVVPNELLLGIIGTNTAPGSLTLGSGWGNLDSTPPTGGYNNTIAVEDRFVNSTGSYTANMTAGSSVGYLAVIAAYKIAIKASVSNTVTTSTSVNVKLPNALQISASESVTTSEQVGEARVNNIGPVPSDSTTLSESVALQIVFPPTPQNIDKTYLYKVFDPTDNYLGIWPDVSSAWKDNQNINTAGAVSVVTLSRNSEVNLPGNIDALTEGGDNINTEASNRISVESLSPNAVGPGTLVDLNLHVQVFVYYGYVDPLTDDNHNNILTDSGQTIDMEIGAPNGRCIFQGRILRYDAYYGGEEKVMVTLAPYGTDMDNYLLMNGSSTTKAYTQTEPAQFPRDALSGYGGKLVYDSTSIANTGILVDYTFRMNTMLEVIEKAKEFAPADWAWWIDMGTNTVYLQPRSPVISHTFVLGKHIHNLVLTETLEQVRNTLTVLGGPVGGVSTNPLLYRMYQNAASVTQYGQWLDRFSDFQLVQSAAADILGAGQVGSDKSPSYQSDLIIPANVYDIESIQLGQTIGFSNFNNYIDGVTMRIVAREYTGEQVTLKLDSIMLSPSRRLAEVKRDLVAVQSQDIPDTPVNVSV